MSKWSNFYVNRQTEFTSYRAYAAKRYAPFIDCFVQHRKEDHVCLELGCGLGTITSILQGQSLPYVFRAIDNDKDMVEYAWENGVLADVSTALIPYRFPATLIHSHGLLEHFTDEQIAQCITAQKLSGAKYAYHYVPGNKYTTPSFGDERLLSIADWYAIANPTLITTFNAGFDYILHYDWT